MKEIIVIKQDWLVKDMKAGVPELDKLFICQKVEQVPENWEELKSLCKNLKDIQIVSNVIYLEQEDLGRIELYIDGVIVCNEYVIAEDRTAAQMWKFILSLTEKNNVVDRKR